jgi:hypothetical protein
MGYYPGHVADPPDGRRWLRWDQEIPAVCPECSRPWGDHPGPIEIRAVDGHMGHVLPLCQPPDNTKEAPDLPAGIATGWRCSRSLAICAALAGARSFTPIAP